jgi:hypothetical protein
MERRLAAILAADVAGYSRLMGIDEEGTLAQLKTHRRELVDPKISTSQPVWKGSQFLEAFVYLRERRKTLSASWMLPSKIWATGN